MASWSSTSTKGNTDGSLPSLVSIMQEQEVEDKHERMASHAVGKAQAQFSALWKPLTVGTDASPMTKIMNEQGITSGTSRSHYKFKPTDGSNERQTPYTKRENIPTNNAQADRVTSPMTKTSVVNVRKQSLKSLGYKDLVDWLKDPSHVYIGRNMTHYVPGAVGSKWGSNPFKSGKGGTRETSTEMYRQYILTDTKIHANGKTLRNSLDELKGKTLGCWCHPELCHGHILVQLIEEHCE